MRKPMFALLTLAFALFGTQCRAQGTGCVTDEGGGVTCPFSPATTTNTYTFADRSTLTVQFVTVLTTFDLRVAESHPTEATIQSELDPNDFPSPSQTHCVPPFDIGECNQYDFTGNKTGPHGVPVRNIDYKGLITLILSYFYNGPVGDPAFGHAPGDSTTFEDILTGYSTLNPPEVDPTMDGDTPGLSSVIALAKPLSETDTFCFVSPNEGDSFKVGQQIEVTFQLYSPAGGSCPIPITATPIRDKTAHLSLSARDTNGNPFFPALLDREEANKFHWENKDGINEFDLSTVGLAPGPYTITVRGSKFSAKSVHITLTP